MGALDLSDNRPQDVYTRAPFFSDKRPQDQITREEPLSRDVKCLAEQLDRSTDELNDAQEKLDDVIEGELQ